MTNGPNTDQEVSASVSNLAGVWQPIETAPKGRAVLVFDGGNGHIFAARWDGDCWASTACASDAYATDEATHWMSLPSPPE